MRLRLNYKGISPVSHEGVQALVNGWAEKHLKPLLAHMGFAESELVATVAKRAKGDEKYAVKLHLHLPRRKILVAAAESGDLKVAIDDGLERLLRETERHVARLRHQAAYKRKVQRLRLRELKARLAELPAAQREEAQAAIAPLLPRLERIALRELAYLRSVGDLSPDYPTLRDVVDEAAVAVQEAWQAGGDRERVFRLLLRELFKVLDREVRANSLYGEMLSLDTPPPPDAKDQAETMVGEEAQEFWQPDEVLRLEDIIPDETAVSAETGADEEKRVFLFHLMRDLPLFWRRAWLLREFESMTVPDLAEVLEKDRATVSAWLDQASSFLQARMAEAGLASIAGQPLTIRTAPSSTNAPESTRS